MKKGLIFAIVLVFAMVSSGYAGTYSSCTLKITTKSENKISFYQSSVTQAFDTHKPGYNWATISYTVNDVPGYHSKFKVKYDGGKNQSGSNRRLKSTTGSSYLYYYLQSSKSKSSYYKIGPNVEKEYTEDYSGNTTKVKVYAYYRNSSTSLRYTYTDTITMTGTY